MKKQYIFLNLLQIKFPVTAIVSILHRVSGVFIFILIPALLYMLQSVVTDLESFNALQKCLSSNVMKTFMLVMLASILYHTIAGTRHLLMDMGLGEGKCMAKISSWLVFLFTALSVGATGYKLWCM